MITKEIMLITIRSIISLLVLFFSTKLLGKKQTSQLSLFDYTIGISIGNFTAEMVLNFENPFYYAAIPIITFGLIGYIISSIMMKSIILKNIIIGKPTILIDNGKILYNSFKKLKINIFDFMEQARNEGYFNINEISYAIMEVNGKISFLLKDKYTQPTKEDLNIKQNDKILPINIIIDSKIISSNIEKTNHNENWFKKELKKLGYTNYKDIILATYDNKEIKIYKKNECLKTPNVLE